MNAARKQPTYKQTGTLEPAPRGAFFFTLFHKNEGGGVDAIVERPTTWFPYTKTKGQGLGCERTARTAPLPRVRHGWGRGLRIPDQGCGAAVSEGTWLTCRRDCGAPFFCPLFGGRSAHSPADPCGSARRDAGGNCRAVQGKTRGFRAGQSTFPNLPWPAPFVF